MATIPPIYLLTPKPAGYETDTQPAFCRPVLMISNKLESNESCNLQKLQTGDYMLITDHIILVLLWLLFGVLHSVLAAGWWKRIMQQWLGAKYRYYHFSYSVFAAVTMILILVFQSTMHSYLLYVAPVWVRVLLCLPVLAGVVIMLVVIRKYFFALSGISVFYKRQPPVALELGGLHRYVRHPLYFGTLLFIWSLFFVFPYLSNGLAGLVITGYTVLGAKLEEKKLALQFGEKYGTYKQKVPMLIPNFFTTAW